MIDNGQATQAQIDGNRATLAELVDHVRKHRETCKLGLSRACVGMEMWVTIAHVDPLTLQDMFAFALCELADHTAPATSETEHLLRNPNNAAAMRRSIAELDGSDGAA